MTMILELPESLEAALRAQADARGVSPAGYVREVLKRNLEAADHLKPASKPFRTGLGMFSKYGQAPSSEEIDANRAEMFHSFGEATK